MSLVSIVINVSDQAQTHSNGLAGTYIVPGKAENQEFGMLVIMPGYEIQGVGDNRKEIHIPKARKIAEDIVGLNSDAAAHTVGSRGTKEKWGLLLCAAEPDVPRALEEAIEAEAEYLNANPPDVKQRYDQKYKINVAVNIESDSIKAQKEEFSLAVLEQRDKFENSCRKMVTKEEIARAKTAMHTEDQRLISEADNMHAQGEESRKNINELHKNACIRMGQERPWCYVPLQLVDCPGCGAKIKENVLTCAHCQGWLDEGIEELRVMKPKERAAKMYPERMAAEPVTAGKK